MDRQRGLWADMERVDEIIPSQQKPVSEWRPLSSSFIRRISKASNNPGKISIQCNGCKSWFIQSYVTRGWSADMHWPKDADWFCKDCVTILDVRKE